MSPKKLSQLVVEVVIVAIVVGFFAAVWFVGWWQPLVANRSEKPRPREKLTFVRSAYSHPVAPGETIGGILDSHLKYPQIKIKKDGRWHVLKPEVVSLPLYDDNGLVEWVRVEQGKDLGATDFPSEQVPIPKVFNSSGEQVFAIHACSHCDRPF